jgi:glycogen debranching enzyme
VAPNRIDPNFLSLELHLDSQQQIVFSIDIICDGNSAKTPAHVTFEEGLRHIQQEREASPLAQVDINTSNERFNDWLNRSRTDLDMLLAPTAFGHYPYAGIPWFSTIFGRDGLITAFELLWLAPEVAKGVLAYLAATQATSIDPVRDAEPGKILHETRKGEMARLGEVPFGQYYGSVDSTPLFVLLAAAYYERTADTEFLRNIWPNIHSAIDWIDRFGDSDGDGFVEYARKAESGLIQQGWKDSQDSVFHKDGSLAVAPIALCEVQAYVYAAKRGIATVARDLGHADLASNLESQAEEMRKRFSDAFWLDDLGMFALALDGNKRPCSVRSSNAGQCLFTGIANEAQTMRTLETLLDPCLFAGWGIRTIAATEKRYNPMSYHNGSIWPHDNALIAYGSCHLQRKEVALRVLTGLLDVALFVDLNRLPELICGFSRRPGKSPTLYPVACAPQAWAAGAVFMALQACLGLSIQAPQQRVHLYHTALPEALQRVEIRNLKIATAIIDLAFERYSGSVGVNILRRSGTVEIRSQK